MKNKENSILMVVLLGSLIIPTLCILFNRLYIQSKVFVVEDSGYSNLRIASLVPNSMHIEDFVWGNAEINDAEVVLDFFDYIDSLPITNVDTDVSENNTVLSGTLYFDNGDSLEFDLGDYVIFGGFLHGEPEGRGERTRIVSRLKEYLYTKEKLADMVRADNRIKLIGTGYNKNIASDQKIALKELVLSSNYVNYEKEEKEKILNKGNSVLQIEFYINSTLPQVYMIVYESGLCLIYDSAGSRSGSIMQLSMDVKQLESIFWENSNEK